MKGWSRESGVFLGGALLIVLSWWVRPAQPQLAIWDPDTWGYLYPALSWIEGGDFQQMHGRHGFYPSLLLLFIEWGGGLGRIVFYQQLLGVAGAILAWGGWILWLRLLLGGSLGRGASEPTAGRQTFRRKERSVQHSPSNYLPSRVWGGLWWLGVAVGAVLCGLWMFNPHLRLQESEIRPEAVLGFFVAGQALFGVAFLLGVQAAVRIMAWRSWLLGAVGVLALVFAWLAWSLKPSWVFAALGMWPLLAVGLLVTSCRRVVLGIFLVGGLFWFGGSKFYGQWMKPDHASRTFLPMTLLTIHAPWVFAAWEDELAHGEEASWPVRREVLQAFVENFRVELARAKADPGWYVRLGYDPDYLMYRSSVNRPLGEAGTSMEDSIALHKQGFFLAWQKFPLTMSGKVLGQFDYFLRPEARLFAAGKADWPRFWERTKGELAKFAGAAPGPKSSELLAENRRTFLDQPVPEVQMRPVALGWVADVLGPLAPWLIGAFFLWWAVVPWRAAEWIWPGLGAAFLLALPAANALAVSLTHSLDLFRYRFTFAPSYGWALGAIALLLLVWAVEWFYQRGLASKVPQNLTTDRGEI
jgi:hypothetical protein